MTDLNKSTWNKTVRSNSRVSGGDGMDVSRVGQAVAVSTGKKQSAIPTGGSGIFAVKFVEEFDNWVTAHRWNWATEEEGENLLYVAKMPHLRRDFYENDGDPIVYPDAEFLYEYVSASVRKCTDQSGFATYFEEQRITPSYYVGEVFYVFTAQTGLETDEETPRAINTVDLTPRMWARITS